MAVSTNKGYELIVTGSESGTWGGVLNTSVFTIVDSNLGGITTKTLSSSPVTLSASEAQNGIIRVNGALSANVTVTTPCLGFFYFENVTTGDYLVTVQYTGGVGGTIKPAQGMTVAVISDATNGLRFGASGLPPGSIIDYGGSGTRWTGEWLLCDGSAVSRTTYSALFQAISTTWGVGDGSTTFNVPDLRGRATFGRDDMGGSTASRITNAGSGIVGTTLGATGGAQDVTISANNLPTHTHPLTSGDAPIVVTVANGTLVMHTTSLISASAGGSLVGGASGGTTISTVSATATISGNTGNNTTTAATLNKMPNTAIVNKLIKL